VSGWYIDDSWMNELQQKTLMDFIDMHSGGAKMIDIKARKDGVERQYEADFLKHMKRLEGEQNQSDLLMWKYRACQLMDAAQIQLRQRDMTEAEMRIAEMLRFMSQPSLPMNYVGPECGLGNKP
jgi:hypothetical protein